MQTEALVGGKKIWSTYEYEQGSKRLKRQRLDREMAPVVDVDARYRYDPSGTRDVQCFTYDHLRRMNKAWTSVSTAEDPCAGGPAATRVGGVAPYHHEYTFDAVGNRQSEKQYASDGTSLIERSYRYPATTTAQPHTPAGTSHSPSPGCARVRVGRSGSALRIAVASIPGSTTRGGSSRRRGRVHGGGGLRRGAVRLLSPAVQLPGRVAPFYLRHKEAVD
jgi:hypothetical protein